MGDYTQSTDFSAKDNLATGDPAKKIKGSDVDTELEAISSAIATKAENATAETISGDWTHSGDVTISGATTLSGTVTGLDCELLATATASADEYVTFAEVFNSTYQTYIVTATEVQCTTDVHYLLFQVGTGSTPTWIAGTNYTGVTHYADSNANHAPENFSPGALARTTTYTTGTANDYERLNCILNLSGLTNSANNARQLVSSRGWGINNAGVIYQTTGIASITRSADITSIRFTASSDNATHTAETIASGEFRVYGFKDA